MLYAHFMVAALDLTLMAKELGIPLFPPWKSANKYIVVVWGQLTWFTDSVLCILYCLIIIVKYTLTFMKYTSLYQASFCQKWAPSRLSRRTCVVV